MALFSVGCMGGCESGQPWECGGWPAYEIVHHATLC